MARKNSFRCTICNKKGINTRTYCNICWNHHVSTLPCINDIVLEQNNNEENNNIADNTITKKQKADYFQVNINNDMQGNTDSNNNNNIEIDNTKLNQQSQDRTTIISQDSTKIRKCTKCNKIGANTRTHCDKCGNHHPRNQLYNTNS